MLRLTLVSVILLVQGLALKAQFYVERTNEVPTFRQSGSEYQNPWAGGLNAPEPSKFDADYDGEEDDLFIFDKAGNRTLVFIGSNTGQQVSYALDPDRSDDFPDMRNFALLRDFNCDGKRDLFTYSPLGGAMSVWENTGSTATGIIWEQVSEALLSFYEFNSNSYTTNIYTSPLDIPAIFDYEGDGDLDIMSFNVGGSFIELHINDAIENSGSCGFDYYLANRCYGGFVEGEDSNSISLDPDDVAEECTFNVVDPKSGGGPRHVGSTILAFDANNDGLSDLVLGDVGFTNLVYLENSDPPEGPNQVVDYSIEFPLTFGGTPVDIDNFPAAFYEDVDADGIPDLLISVNSTSAAANKESFHVYLNSGSENSPDFNLVTYSFLQEDMLEFGEGTKPATFDYNGDGLMDLVVGSRGEFIEEGVYQSHLVLMENIGTTDNPSFQIADSDWLEISTSVSSQSPAPFFADWDGDSDQDLILGFADGTLHYFEEEGGLNYIGQVQADGADIDVGSLSSPSAFDIDGDGRQDLIVGEADGNLNYYRNTGSTGQMEFEIITENLGNISTVSSPFFSGNSSPVFFRFDGEDYLACGSISGKLFRFEVGEPLSEWVEIDGGGFGAYPEPDSAPRGLDTSPTLYDWNNDVIPDLVVGHIGGGLEFYFGTEVLSANPANKTSKKDILIYPNPVEDFFSLSENPPESELESIEVFNLLGRKVYESNIATDKHYVGNLSSGIYSVRLNLRSGEEQSLILIKK